MAVMSLSKRLNEMERRIQTLEAWKASIEQAIEAEDETDNPTPTLTLYGEEAGGERDQDQPL